MADQPYSGPEIEAAIKILREDAQGAASRLLLERLDKIEERLGRMPVQEMTAEEKAAEYDRLIAAQKGGKGSDPAPGGKPPADPGPPPPPAPAAKPPTPPADPTSRRGWWDGYSQGD